MYTQFVDLQLKHYPLIIVILFMAMILYIKLANKLNIIDKPNERSSHNYLTVRGGGVVWWISGILYSMLNIQESIYFLAGLTLISTISFWDDISSLSSKIRIVVHFLMVSILFYGFGVFQALPWWQILIAYILAVGTLNGFNFMDGINGNTGLYSLVVLIVLQYINIRMINFTPLHFINFAILASFVFLLFNYRTEAKCFAGDVGSMAIGFWILTLLTQLMLATHSLIWIFFLTIYGVDSGCTILHRLYLEQNIFKPHRMFFFHVMVNERGLSNLKISACYALVQFVICFVIIYSYINSTTIAWISGAGMLILCCLCYLLKFEK